MYDVPGEEVRAFAPEPQRPPNESDTAIASASPFRMPEGRRIEEGALQTERFVDADLSPFGGVSGGADELEEV